MPSPVDGNYSVDPSFRRHQVMGPTSRRARSPEHEPPSMSPEGGHGMLAHFREMLVEMAPYQFTRSHVPRPIGVTSALGGHDHGL